MTDRITDAAHRALKMRISDPAELARACQCSIADAVAALALARQPHSAVALTPADVRRVVELTREVRVAEGTERLWRER